MICCARNQYYAYEHFFSPLPSLLLHQWYLSGGLAGSALEDIAGVIYDAGLFTGILWGSWPLPLFKLKTILFTTVISI